MVSEVATFGFKGTYGSRLPGFIAKHKEIGKWLLKKLHANTSLPGSHGPHPTVWAAQTTDIKQILLPILLIPSGWDFAHRKRRWPLIHPSSWFYFSQQFFAFSAQLGCSLLLFNRPSGRTHLLQIASHKSIFIKGLIEWKLWETLIQKLRKGALKAFGNA